MAKQRKTIKSKNRLENLTKGNNRRYEGTWTNFHLLLFLLSSITIPVFRKQNTVKNLYFFGFTSL